MARCGATMVWNEGEDLQMTRDEFALHRYFIWADRMRFHFDQQLKRRASSATGEFELEVEEFMYISLWYAQLYTVIEGWKKLKLTNRTVNNMLANSGYVELLRRYRNGVAHFQSDYFDSRFQNFVTQSDSASWVRNLHQALDRYFLEKLGQKPL